MSINAGIIGIILIGIPFPSLSDDFPYPKDAPADVKDCRNVIFSCDCGNPGYKMQAVVTQCHFWMPPEQACARFQHCLECEDGQDRCVTCPHGRYGRWCNADCNCQNGGTCNEKDGSCRCTQGYEGENCETRAVITTGELNCNTKASTLMSKPGVLVKITCPAGCGTNDVWGTSIYADDSSICTAAIHSGFLREKGGTTYLVNNGPYSNFLDSVSNGISSKRRPREKKSFRFSGPVGLPVTENKKDCPDKWSSSNEFCVLATNREKAWEIATCSS